MEPHRIAGENYMQANDAIRDILFLYQDAVTSYQGFGGDLNTGTFDPFLYVTAVVVNEPGHCLGIELELLHQGSAVALLCGLLDEFACSVELDVCPDQWAGGIRAGLGEGRFDHLPVAKKAFEAAFVDGDALWEALPRVYNDYIRGHYARMFREAEGGA